MKISTRMLAFVIPALLIGGIFLGGMTGWWQTESSKVPVTYSEADYGGEYAGIANPADIRGSYSLADIEDVFSIPVDVLAEAFLVAGEENPGGVLLKEFEERYGILTPLNATGEYEIGTDAMRLFVARYLALPYVAEPDTGIFDPAYELVAAQGSLPEEELTELRMRIVAAPPEGAAETAESALPSVTTETEGSEEYLVKGNTTFGGLLAWGVEESDIRDLLDGEMGQRGEQVRTWCIDRGITYSTVKEDLQRLVDEAVQ